jgi:hypothetical protein
MSPPEDIYEWMARQKFPLDRAGVNKISIAKLAELRACGIRFVELIGCNCAEDECDAYRERAGKVIEIEEALPLPLPGCDQKHCKCIWIAREKKVL